MVKTPLNECSSSSSSSSSSSLYSTRHHSIHYAFQFDHLHSQPSQPYGKATLNSLDKASLRITNSKGRNAEP